MLISSTHLNENLIENYLREISKSQSTKFDKFKVMYQADPEMNRTMASEILQVSRKTINNWINKLDKNEK